LASRSWALENGGLQEQPVTIEGTLSLETLRGTAWRLVKFGLDGARIEDVEATLSFSEEGVAGSAGCNRYSGTAESGEQPGDVRIGPLVSTKMLCGDAQMSVETRYLPKLEAATRFEFFNRFLLLWHPDGDEPGPMVFERLAESATD
jgi:heat shock protein HslJ